VVKTFWSFSAWLLHALSLISSFEKKKAHKHLCCQILYKNKTSVETEDV